MKQLSGRSCAQRPLLRLLSGRSCACSAASPAPSAASPAPGSPVVGSAPSPILSHYEVLVPNADANEATLGSCSLRVNEGGRRSARITEIEGHGPSRRTINE